MNSNNNNNKTSGGGGGAGGGGTGKRRNGGIRGASGAGRGSGGNTNQQQQKEQHAQNQPKNNSNSNNNSTVNNKDKRQNRKANKRTLQLEAMAKKARNEDTYFRQCQREAAAKATTTRQVSTNNTKQRENELFGKESENKNVRGINFAKYDEIKVEVKYGSSNKKNKNNSSNVEQSSPPPQQQEQITPVKEFKNFNELSLTNTLQRNINLMGYTQSTPIQRHAVPLAMNGNDLMCCAQTGSGKTCAFLLPVCIHLLKMQNNTNNTNNNTSNSNNNNGIIAAKPNCIILAPTRELASQIENEAQKLTNSTTLETVCVYGGASAQSQLKSLAYGCDICVATPGRLTDFVDRSLISLADVHYLVLDEADRMLDMGFEPQIKKLVLKSGMKTKEKGRQTLMFSATFPSKIQLLASAFLRLDYVWIAVGRVGSTTESITQRIIQSTNDKKCKLKLVVEAITKGPKGRTLIFVQKKRTASWLKKQLSKGGVGPVSIPGASAPTSSPPEERFVPIEAVEIHGDRTQSQRESALSAFRSGKVLTLVATDVAARGLDINGVEHVINMDLPVSTDDFDSYVHRIGRTGRAGHVGLATSLYVPGREIKVGNGAIGKMMTEQLVNAKQDVPEWLRLEVGVGGSNGVVNGRNGSVSNNGGKGKTNLAKFGGADVRNNSHSAKNHNYHNNNNNNNNNNNGKRVREKNIVNGRGQGVQGRGDQSQGGRGGKSRPNNRE